MKRSISVVLLGLISFTTFGTLAAGPVQLNFGQFDCRRFIFTVENNSAPTLDFTERFTQQLLVEAGNAPGQFYLKHETPPGTPDAKFQYFGNKDIDWDFTNTPFSFSANKNETSAIRSAFNTGPCEIGWLGPVSGRASVQIEKNKVQYTLTCRSANRLTGNVSSRVEQVACIPMNAKVLNMQKIVGVLSR